MPPPPASPLPRALGWSLVDARSSDELVSLARSGGGPLWLIEGLRGEAGQLVVEALAVEVVGPQLAGLDVVGVRPENDRWTTDELDDKIIRRAQLAPAGALRVIAIGFAETLTRPQADHLLKTFEEPAPTTRFIMSVDRAEHLPATIRGRASATCRVHPAPADLQAAALAGAGVDPAVVAQVLHQCGPLIALAAAVLEKSDLRSDATLMFDSDWDLALPLSAAQAVLAATDRLVAGWAATDRAAGRSEVDDKVRRREILRRLVECAELRTRAELSRVTSARGFVALEKRLEIIDRARAQIGVYVSAAEALSALFAGLAPTPR